jgi:hypothetical protein
MATDPHDAVLVHVPSAGRSTEQPFLNHGNRKQYFHVNINGHDLDVVCDEDTYVSSDVAEVLNLGGHNRLREV